MHSGLGTAGAGTRELQVGLLKLAALDVGRDELLLLGDVLDHVVPNGLLVHLLLGGNHLEGALGQTLTQLVQPMQSSGDTAMVNFMPLALGPMASSVRVASGAAAASSSVIANGRMVACGHT